MKTKTKTKTNTNTNTNKHKHWIIAVSAFLLVGCGGEGGENNPNPPGPDLLPQTYEISECGGFKAELKSAPPAPMAYCDAEVLDWSYDSASGKLTFSNNRVLLNCCGDRKVTITEVNGVYEILETDGPEQSSGARCHCMCVFDLAVAADKIASGTIDIKLKRDVTDDNKPAPEVVHTGKLDLTQGSGQVVVDTTDVGMWCGQP